MIRSIDERTLRSFLSDWMQTAGIPGAALTIVSGDEQRCSIGIGSRNYRQNVPATPDTLFGIGSCTKSVTALSIMQLAEEGALSVADPVTDHLPYSLWENEPPVTIHQLLTHSSGLPGDGMAYLTLGRQLDLDGPVVSLGSDRDLIEFLDGLAEDRIHEEENPFFYQNSGYYLLGEVIKHHTGRSLQAYASEAIFEPLHMERTTFDETAFSNDENAMTPYLLQDGKPTERPFPFDPLVAAAGGMLSSTNELGRYLQLYLNDGSFEGTTLLEQDTIEQMFEGYLQWDYGTSSSTNEYGYGWTVKTHLDQPLISHIGDVVVSSAYLGILPEEDLGIALAANASPEYILQPVGEALVAMLLGKDPYETVPFFAVREKLDELTGNYRSYRGIVSGSLERNGVTLEFTPDRPPALELTLYPATTDRYEYDFYTLSAEGERKPVTVIYRDDGSAEIRYARWRLIREC